MIDRKDYPMDSQPDGPEIAATRTISFTRIVDLSRSIEPGIPLWPGDPAVEFQVVAHLDAGGYFMRRFSMGEHSATHMNAPSSFYPDGVCIDQYPPESLVAQAAVIDGRRLASPDADYTLGLDDVYAWEKEHSPVPHGSILLFFTGWQHKWSQAKAYLGGDAAGELHFPGFGQDAARYLIAERGVLGLGIDTHGVDGGQDNTFAINKLVLQQPRIVLENLFNLDQLPPTGVTLVIGLPRLKGGSGAPVAVLAFLP